MMRNRLLGLFLASTFITLGFGAAVAQTRYDAPTISLEDRGLFRLTLGVTAGATGAPNGFTIEWMTKANYDLNGGWPANGYSNVVYCSFLGAPTLNVWAGSPLLGANQTAYVQPGDLFDETNINGDSYDPNYAYYTDQLNPHTEYVIRAQVIGDGNLDASEYSATTFVTTLFGECTQGFWKTHPERWPTCTVCLGKKCDYTQDELLKIYNTPANGNGLISLAHQLITAQLNICNGSDQTAIASTIADAQALIDQLVVPTVGSGYLAPSQTSDLTETLDDYNNGLLGGVADCPTPVRTNTTWGRLKVLYR